MLADQDLTRQKSFRRQRLKSTIGTSLLMMGASLSVGTGFFIIPGTEFFGVTTGQFLLWYSLFSFSSAVSMIVIGKLSNTVGIKNVVIVSSGVAMLAGINMAFTTNFGVFLAFSALLGVGWSGSTLLAANILVNGWHQHPQRGTVLGLVMGASGIGGLLWGIFFPPVIDAGGFQAGVLTLALLVGLLMFIPGIVLIKNPPLISSPEPVQTTPNRAAPKRSLHYAVTFSSLVVIGFLISLESPLSQILPAVFDTIDISAQVSGILVAVWSVTNTIMMPFLGWFYDRFGLRATIIFMAIAYGSGFIGLAIANSLIAVALTLPLLSIAISAMTVLLPLVVSLSVGEANFPNVYGVVTTAVFCGLAVGTPLWGMTFDLTGDYTIALVAGALLGVLCLIGMGVVVRQARRWFPHLVAPASNATPTSTSASGDLR